MFFCTFLLHFSFYYFFLHGPALHFGLCAFPSFHFTNGMGDLNDVNGIKIYRCFREEHARFYRHEQDKNKMNKIKNKTRHCMKNYLAGLPCGLACANAWDRMDGQTLPFPDCRTYYSLPPSPAAAATALPCITPPTSPPHLPAHRGLTTDPGWFLFLIHTYLAAAVAWTGLDSSFCRPLMFGTSVSTLPTRLCPLWAVAVCREGNSNNQCLCFLSPSHSPDRNGLEGEDPGGREGRAGHASEKGMGTSPCHHHGLTHLSLIFISKGSSSKQTIAHVWWRWAGFALRALACVAMPRGQTALGGVGDYAYVCMRLKNKKKRPNGSVVTVALLSPQHAPISHNSPHTSCACGSLLTALQPPRTSLHFSHLSFSLFALPVSLSLYLSLPPSVVTFPLALFTSPAFAHYNISPFFAPLPFKRGRHYSQISGKWSGQTSS